MRLSRLFMARAVSFGLMSPVLAEDLLKLAVPQRGNWDAATPDLGSKIGIFAKHGIKLDILYTAGTGETVQAVTSGSVDIGTATGTTGILATFAKGAPLWPISASMTGVDDIFWYMPANSPLKTLKDADGKTMVFSSTCSSANLGALALIKQAGVNIKAVATGTAPSTFT